MKTLETLRRKCERHGVWNTLYALVLKAINSVVVLRILRGVHVATPEPSFLQCPGSYAPGLLTAEALRGYAQDPKTELSDGFLDRALARGDQCYAIRDGTTLAAYGWYSAGSTPVGLGDLLLSFDSSCVYMYKGFTDARYRGQRLHAIGMTRALQHYRRHGYLGLVSYVEADNFDSLKSCFRMGYAIFGSIYVIRVFGHYLAFSSPGCKRFGFHLHHAGGGSGMLTFRKD